MKSRQGWDQRYLTVGMCAGVGMGFIVYVWMDNGGTIDDMAMGKETDIHIVKCEDWE